MTATASHDTPHETDVILVGAGPIGLEMAVALKQAGIDYQHFEKGQIGATMMWWAPGTQWFSSNERISIAGIPLLTPNQTKATREQYLTYLRTVVRTFDLAVHTYEPVVAIEAADDTAVPLSVEDGDALPDLGPLRDDEPHRFAVTTESNRGRRQWRAKRIVLAVGDTDKAAPLNIPGEDLPHVSHYLEEPHKYFNQRVLIVGGRNSAAEAALRLWHTGCDITLSYRRAAFQEGSIKYWLLPELLGRIDRGEITCHYRTVPEKITPSHVTLRDPDKDAPIEVEADFVLLMTGFENDVTLFNMAGVEFVGEKQAPAFDRDTMASNVPGVYVAGTAVAGPKELYAVFLENCHIHVDRIRAHLRGEAPPRGSSHPYALPET